jgi:hypothetical protein
MSTIKARSPGNSCARGFKVLKFKFKLMAENDFVKGQYKYLFHLTIALRNSWLEGTPTGARKMFCARVSRRFSPTPYTLAGDMLRFSSLRWKNEVQKQSSGHLCGDANCVGWQVLVYLNKVTLPLRSIS